MLGKRRGDLYTDSKAWIHYQDFAVSQNPNQLCCCYLLGLWQPCCILTPGAYILGGGIVTLAQRIQNGFRKILQVCLHNPYIFNVYYYA